MTTTTNLTKIHTLIQNQARRRCPSWLAICTDDIAQLACLRVHRKLAAQPDRPLTAAYVDRAVRHVVVDVTRRKLRREALASRFEPAAHGADPHDPETLLLGHELADRVDAELARLPPARRQVVALYLQGHGVSEIAARLGCDRKRVDNLVHRGLATLRQQLAAEGLSPLPSAA